ncbi:hypothetical protein QAD02_022918 [Eretmocerus hayati]|uniref:Uncharacterized protein n=1 Tax=Eretmocerus hayati TaxID=131215 RepID=A0ACC2PWV4_9HYME|nr:hypothetical protein QAD02_022918 [Eretmocerus hayati]
MKTEKNPKTKKEDSSVGDKKSTRSKTNKIQNESCKSGSSKIIEDKLNTDETNRESIFVTQVAIRNEEIKNEVFRAASENEAQKLMLEDDHNKEVVMDKYSVHASKEGTKKLHESKMNGISPDYTKNVPKCSCYVVKEKFCCCVKVDYQKFRKNYILHYDDVQKLCICLKSPIDLVSEKYSGNTKNIKNIESLKKLVTGQNQSNIYEKRPIELCFSCLFPTRTCVCNKNFSKSQRCICKKSKREFRTVFESQEPHHKSL